MLAFLFDLEARLCELFRLFLGRLTAADANFKQFALKLVVDGKHVAVVHASRLFARLALGALAQQNAVLGRAERSQIAPQITRSDATQKCSDFFVGC